MNKIVKKIIGTVGVDAGLIWIGDPCYIMHQNPPPKSIGTSWSEFCDTIPQTPNPTMKSYNFDLGHEGLGVCVSSGLGDGSYPVEVELVNVPGWGLRIKSAKVKFL